MDEKQRTVPCILQGQKQKNINENLLINWDFRDPINRQGKTQYKHLSNWTRTIDAWYILNNGIVEVTNNGIKLSTDNGDTYFSQNISEIIKREKGKYLTISVLFDSYSANQVTIGVRGPGNQWFNAPDMKTQVCTGEKLVTFSFEVPQYTIESINGVTLIYFYLHNGANAVIKAIKMEYGNVKQTLAEKNSDNEWEIIDKVEIYKDYINTLQFDPFVPDYNLQFKGIDGLFQDIYNRSIFAYSYKVWISDTGDDANVGTVNEPMKTISGVLSKYKDYNCIYLIPINDEFHINNSFRVVNKTLILGSSANRPITKWYFDVGSQSFVINGIIGFEGVQIYLNQNLPLNFRGISGAYLGDFYSVNIYNGESVPSETNRKYFIGSQNTDFISNNLSLTNIFIANRMHIHPYVSLFSASVSWSSSLHIGKIANSNIDENAYLYNKSNAKDQIGTTGVYVLR